MITLLDYGAGNVQSVINALNRFGESVSVARSGADLGAAERLVFPGVGSFGSMMQTLDTRGFHGGGSGQAIATSARAHRPSRHGASSRTRALRHLRAAGRLDDPRAMLDRLLGLP
jgi:hypothetical protein